jgi:2-dehydro-3-deoxyphosphogluconate aldolase/(4S)-4-hydroxy-2-oxoglutarate aldolase
MGQQSVYEKIGKLKIIPVITIEDPSKALALADALIEGGLPVAEITFRTPAAGEVMKIISRERPDFLVGAGTILTVDNLKMAADCGASFGVAPGLTEKIVQAALDIHFPFSPGIMTPSELQAAIDMNVRVLKFFPAEAAGGSVMLKNILAPFAHLGIRYIPTGGITTGKVKDYLEIPQVIAAGGSWIASKDDIANGSWEKVKKNCLEIRRLIAQ